MELIALNFFKHYYDIYTMAIVFTIALTGITLNLTNWWLFSISLRLKILLTSNSILILIVLFAISSHALMFNYDNIYILILVIMKSVYFATLGLYMQRRSIKLLRNWQIYIGNIAHLLMFTYYILYKLNLSFGIDFGIARNISRFLLLVPAYMYIFHILKILRIVRDSESSSANQQHVNVKNVCQFLLVVNPILFVISSVFGELDGFPDFDWVFMAMVGYVDDFTELLAMLNKNRKTSNVIWLLNTEDIKPLRRLTVPNFVFSDRNSGITPISRNSIKSPKVQQRLAPN